VYVVHVPVFLACLVSLRAFYSEHWWSCLFFQIDECHVELARVRCHPEVPMASASGGKAVRLKYKLVKVHSDTFHSKIIGTLPIIIE
jgi:hypothetical protein